jgi:hypothetical protein
VGLQYLHGLIELRRIDLTDTRVTSEGLSKLQARRPGLKIVLDGSNEP